MTLFPNWAPKTPPAAAPTVGKTSATSRYIVGPLLRAASNVPALQSRVAAIARNSEPLPTDDRQVNQHEVVPGVLLRGGQLSTTGLQRLARERSPGLILNLAAEYPQAATGEAATAKGLGIETRELLLAPMRAPTSEQVEAFISLVDQRKQAVAAAKTAGTPVPGPLYVHCFAGSDRTGALVACYRITRQGWSVDAALAEMSKDGANAALHPDFEAFVRRFAATHPAEP